MKMVKELFFVLLLIYGLAGKGARVHRSAPSKCKLCLVQSEFQKAYDSGISKAKYWDPTYEDSLLIHQIDDNQ